MLIDTKQAIAYGIRAAIAQSNNDPALVRHISDGFRKLLVIADNKRELQQAFDKAYREERQAG